MKLISKLTQMNNGGILILRLVIGIIFIVHGTMKWSMWGMEPSDQMPASTITIMNLLSIAEPLGGVALILGFLTPYASIGLSIIMLGAINAKINMFHLKFVEQQAAGWEFDLLLLSGLLCILFSGAGKFSIDKLLFKKNLYS